jgi:SynChlorMet cassette radical SAM/SPASM protein ScmF
MSVMRRNREQIEPVVRLAEQLGAGSVKFNIVEPTARGERMHEEGETMSVKELIELGQWVERTLSDSTELRLVYDYPAAFHPLGRMLGGNGDGCCVCGILRIMGVLADGSYALCGIGEIVPELVLGHAAVDRLEDVWNKASLLQELREGLPGRLEGVCRECFMKGVCLGSCIAQNYYRCRNLWAPFWFCDEAEREGLFPETRRYRPDMLVQRHTLI